MSEKSVSAIAVIDLARQLLALNIITRQDIAPPLRHYFSDRHLPEPASALLQEQRLPEAYLLNLWLLAEQKALQPGFGLTIGSTVNQNAKGILANWISQAGTLAEVFDIFSRHIMLLNPSESWCLSKQKNTCMLSFTFLDNPYPVAAIERSMSALLAWAGYFCGFTIPVNYAGFTYARPQHYKDYHKVFGKNISFNAESNCLVFSREVMNLPTAHANPYLKQVIGERAKSILHRLSGQKSLSGQINALLSADLRRYSQQQYICEQLHMSRSTLYRKLKAEQTSFSELLDKVRKRKALLGIENQLTVEQQCRQLCFHDSSSLYKAYRRWSLSP